MIAFGPVPSRRLGRSLGINNIPSKWCSYSCAYCQIGRTPKRVIDRRDSYGPERVLAEVIDKLKKLQDIGEPVDYLTFVANGEPTLDANLGSHIRALAPLGIRIAVITNSSLLWKEDVRADLAQADWVSVKMDSVSERVWRKLNRPHPSLALSSVLEGVRRFAETFRGDLVTETMLVSGVNDHTHELKMLSEFLGHLNLRCCCLAVPIRPPAESWVEPPGMEVLSRCRDLMANGLPAVEYMSSYLEEPFTLTGSVERDLLSITAVHPMDRKAVEEFLEKASADWSIVERLLADARLTASEFQGKLFFRKSPSAEA